MGKKHKERWEYRTIDNNWTYKPTAYCSYYDGVLTERLEKVHRCVKRRCRRYDDTVIFENGDGS